MGGLRQSKTEETCAICGAVFRLTAQQAADRKQTCSRACAVELMSRSKGGLCEAACEECGSAYRVIRFYVERGRRFCSHACRMRSLVRHNTGPGSPLWKGGGIDGRGPNWPTARRLAWERDGFKCTCCGVPKQGNNLVAHHIVPFDEYGLKRYEEANRLSNLETLCRTCHMRRHHEMGRTPRRAHAYSA